MSLSRAELTERLTKLEEEVAEISSRQHDIIKRQKDLADADVVHTNLVRDLASKLMGNTLDGGEDAT